MGSEGTVNATQLQGTRSGQTLWQARFVHKSYANTWFGGCWPPAAGPAESVSEGRAVVCSQRREARRAGGQGSSKEQAGSSPKSFLSLPSLPLIRSRQKRAQTASFACPACPCPDPSVYIWPLDLCRWRATRGRCPASGEHTLLRCFVSLCVVPGLQTHYGSVGCP